MNPPAVILGMSATGLAIARSLSDIGVDIYGMDQYDWEIAYHSRWIKKLPFSFLKPDERLATHMINWAKELPKRPVVFFAADPYIEFAARYYDALKDYFVFTTYDLPFMAHQIMQKDRFYKLCQEKDIDLPKTILPEEIDRIEDVDMRYPIILKPVYSHKARKFLGGKKVIVINNRAQLLEIWGKIPDDIGGFMLQELIVGPEENLWTVAMLTDNDGNLIAALSGQKLRQYPVDFGSATLFKTKTNEQLVEHAKEVNKRLGLRGIVSHEYKFDPESGKYLMIEINPRTSLWWNVCKQAGVDIIGLAYKYNVYGFVPKHLPEQRDDVTWQYLIRDLAAIAKRGTIRPDVWIDALRPKDSYAVIELADPKLSLYYPIYAGVQGLRYARKR